MFKKVLILTAVVLFFPAREVQANVIHSTWVGCEDGMWGDANNWDPPIVPDNGAGNTFVVTIDTRSCPPGLDVRLQQNRTIDRLDTYGDVDLEKRLREDLGDIVLELAEDFNLTLSVNELLTNHGTLRAEVIIRGKVTNATGATFRLDDMEIEGDFYNEPGATMHVNYEIDVEQGDLENAGLIQIAPTGEIYVNQHFNNTGQIIIYGGKCGADEEILDNNSTGVIKGFGILSAEQLLRNKGDIHAYGGSLAIITHGFVINSGTLGNVPLSSLHINVNEDVNNLGTIEVNAGGGVVFDSNLNNEPKAVIALLGGTLSATKITQAAGATFEGQGNITTANLLIETDGLIRLNGPTNIFGDVQIDPNATLEISDGLTLVKGKTTCNGTIHLKGGWLIPQGGLSGDCNIIWEPGLYTNIADFNLDGKVNIKDFALFADTWLWQTSWY